MDPEQARLSEPIFEYVAGDCPLLISFPHSGTHVPPHLGARLRPRALDLPDTDWFVPELYECSGELGASVLRATHTRYAVDLNRPPDGAPLYPGRRETTVCPTETFDGEPLYLDAAKLSPAETASRLETYWRPYHDKLGTLTQELVTRFGRCVLWDAHSIYSTVPALFDGRLPDLNVGTAGGRSCSPALADRVVACLSEQTQFSFVMNGRFQGGYITRHYGNPSERIDAVQLEIAQCAYLVEARVPTFDAARARPLRLLLRQLLQSVLLVAIALGLSLFSTASRAAPLDLATLTCGKYENEVLPAAVSNPIADNVNTVMWLFGYSVAKSGAHVLYPDALAPFGFALDSECKSNSNESLLDALASVKPEAKTPMDLAALQCSAFVSRHVPLTMSDPESATTIMMWLFGFSVARSGSHIFDPESMHAFEAALLANCAKRPDRTLLDALTKVSKPAK